MVLDTLHLTADDIHVPEDAEADSARPVPVLIRVQGTSPLLCQSDRVMMPSFHLRDEYRQLTAKRKKTDADHDRIARIEFEAGIYVDPDHPELGPAVPSVNLFASVRDGARLHKLGREVERALSFTGAYVPLRYGGPRDIEELWQDGRFAYFKSVVVQRARTMRCRPIFHRWSFEAAGTLLTGRMNPGDLAHVVREAGRYVGIGTWRTGGFGRFSADISVEEA
jgi:hypothetical protein